MREFSPRLDVLPEAQRRLWVELSAAPDEFTLYRGTALALHLGHRKSIDFDFFGSRAIDVAALEEGIPFLQGAPVKVSFFRLPKLPGLAPPVIAKDNGLKIAAMPRRRSGARSAIKGQR